MPFLVKSSRINADEGGDPAKKTFIIFGYFR